MVYMDLNEAAADAETDVSLVTYCASLLRVNPARLLRFVLEES